MKTVAVVPDGDVTGDEMPLEVLEEEVCRLAAQLAAGTARYLLLLASFDERQGWAADGVLSCVQWMSWRLGVSSSTAREQLRVARALSHLPGTAEQFGRGALSYSKVRAITRVATPETEAELVQVGLTAPAAHLDRLVRGLTTAADAGAALERAEERRRGGGNVPPDLEEAPRYGLTWSWTHEGALTGSFRFSPEDGAAFLGLVRGAVQEVERLDAAPPPLDAAPSPTAEALAIAADTGTGTGTGTGTTSVGGAPASADGTRGGSTTPAPGLEVGSRAVVGSGAKVGSWVTGGRGVEEGAGCAAAEAPDEDDAATSDVIGGGGAPPRSEEGRSGAERYRWQPPRHLGADVVRVLLESAREGAALARGPRRAVTEVVVHVDADLLAGLRTPTGAAGEQLALADGPGLLLDTVRRLACDAAVRWASDGPGGATLDLGRRTRRPSPSQLAALERRDRGCVVPGCGRRAFLHAHHVRHWADGGATDLDNLVLLCGAHHRLLHDGGFDVRALGGQRFEVVDRQGRPLQPAPAVSGDAEVLVAAHAHLDGNALTPQWWGEPLHAAEATGALLARWADRATAGGATTGGMISGGMIVGATIGGGATGGGGAEVGC